MNKYKYGFYPSYITSRRFTYICCASFEDRCFTTASNMIKYIDNSLIFQFEEFSKHSNENCAKLSELLKTDAISLKNSDPVFTAKKIYNSVAASIEHNLNSNILVDITTFTREALLILWKVLSQLNKNYTSCCVVYNASSSFNPPWISMGIESIRSIIGFPGDILPTKGDCLIIIPGFEVERAQKIIEQCEPALIRVAISSAACSINEELFSFAQKYLIEIFSEKLEDDATFFIDLTNPFSASKSLEKEARKYSDKYNTIIVPLNTKLSTIGAGMCCLANKNMQILYAQASVYNYNNFFQPSDDYYFYYMPTHAFHSN
ncbi:hypothetical protein K9F62_11140 [Desulfovibrio sp. JY]|nr:hypothetical protein K9F62_11140 [Desulfovibrio sp. JY]